MNTYWAETHAREHVDRMAAEATGDRLLTQAAQQAPDRLEPAGPAPFRRARAKIQALALRQLRFASRSR